MPLNERRMQVAVVALVLAAAAVVCICLQNGKNRLHTATSFLMDTVIEVHLYGPQAQEASAEILQTVADFESETSRHLADSDLAQLNAQAGGAPVAVGERLFSLLARSKQIAQEYSGCFDVTIGPVASLWGITSENPQVPQPQQLQQAVALVDHTNLLLDEAAGTAQLRRAGQSIDLGGIAKGAVCTELFAVLEKYGIQNGYISLGGNLLVVGRDVRQRQEFRFGLRDPFGEPNTMFGIVTLPGKTMSTAGGYERWFEEDGVRYHHILDPVSGYPAESDLVSVSVISEDGALADALSTAFFVGGSALLEQHLQEQSYGVIAVRSDRGVYCSPHLLENFTLCRTEDGFYLVD